MKVFAAIAGAWLISSLNVGAVDPTPAASVSATPGTAVCGPFPKLYREITWNWMQKTLVDPDSAKIEWLGEPQCIDLGTNGQHEYGWRVNFTINSRNRWGAYTGKQQHGVLIRNGEVVKGIGFGY